MKNHEYTKRITYSSNTQSKIKQVVHTEKDRDCNFWTFFRTRFLTFIKYLMAQNKTGGNVWFWRSSDLRFRSCFSCPISRGKKYFVKIKRNKIIFFIVWPTVLYNILLSLHSAFIRILDTYWYLLNLYYWHLFLVPSKVSICTSNKIIYKHHCIEYILFDSC